MTAPDYIDTPEYLREEIAELREQVATLAKERDEAHRLVREMGLSAQGGEVPDLDNYETRPCEPCYANEDPEDWCAIAQWESDRADAWKAFAQLQARTAPPHPDMVEVPARAAWLNIEEMAQAIRQEFGTHPTIALDYARAIGAASILKADRLRAQAQPATEREGTA